MSKPPDETMSIQDPDYTGNCDYWLFQKGSKDLPKDGPERPANELYTQDSTEGKPDQIGRASYRERVLVAV